MLLLKWFRKVVVVRKARLEVVRVVGEIVVVFVYVAHVVALGDALGCAIEADALALGAGGGLVVLVVLADRCQMRFSTSLFSNLLAGRPKSVLNQLSTSWLMGFC